MERRTGQRGPGDRRDRLRRVEISFFSAQEKPVFSPQGGHSSPIPSWGRVGQPPHLAHLHGASLPSSRLPCCLLSSPSPRARVSRVTGEKGRPWSPSASYDLRERLCPGSALGGPGGPEQQVPTDEAEAQMLGSADLDDMKSE